MDAASDERPPADADTADADATDADTTDAGPVLRWPSSAVGEIAIAATNDTLAIAYVENSSNTALIFESRLMLQLLDADLNALGTARELDRQASGNVSPIPSMATNGSTFLVCWSPIDQVRCLGSDGASGSIPLFQTGGITPTVVFHGDAWALAYVASPTRSQMNEVHLVRLSPDGAPLGDPAAFPYDAYFSRPVPFVSTPSGFALLAGQPKLSLYRLTGELAVQGTPMDTGLMSWGYRALAATDDEAAMALAKPYGNVLVHVRGSEMVLFQERGCSEKGGCDTAVALEGTTFAVAWWTTDQKIAFFADIDHAGSPNDVLATVSSPIMLMPFRSRLLVVSRDAP